MSSIQEKLVDLNGEQVKLVIWQDNTPKVVVHNGRLTELVDDEYDFGVHDEKNSYIESFLCSEVYTVAEHVIIIDRENSTWEVQS